MNIACAAIFTIAIAYFPHLHAQGCSGGTDGGTDATGNQCSAPSHVLGHGNEFAPTMAAPSGPPTARKPIDAARPRVASPARKMPPQFRSTARKA